jgi:cytochrome c6
MKKLLVLTAAGILTAGLAMASPEGKELFEKKCAVCHPGAGNIINPEKTLHQKTREANGVKTVNDIVAKMRKPGSGMTTFDEKSLPDAEARAIAEYIQATFK